MRGEILSETRILLSLLLLAAAIAGSLIWYSYSVLNDLLAERRAAASESAIPASEKLVQDR